MTPRLTQAGHTRAHRYLLALLAMGGLAGCVPGASGDGSVPPGNRACTEIGCVDGFRMGIVRPGGFSPGTYRFELTADGVSGFCEVVMPLLCSREPRCERWPGGAVVEQSGCALGDPKAQSLPGVSFTGVAPGTIELTVLQDGRRLGNGRFAPVYRKSEPNGPGCGPVCRNAPEGMLALEP